MKTSAKMSSVATLAILAGLVLGWLARGWWGAEPTPLTAVERTNPGAVLPVVRQTGDPDSASLRKLIESVTDSTGDSRADLEFAPAQFEGYLQRHRRNAGSLLAVYRITKDEALLREAYENFPEDPRVAAQALTSLNLSLEEKLAMLEKVRQAHPDNPLSDLLASLALAKEGNTVDALRFLQDSLAKPSLDFGLKARRLDMREALMSIGQAPTEARVLSAVTAESFFPQLIPIAKLGREEMQRLLQAGREDEAFTLAGQMLAMSRRMEASSEHTLADRMVSTSLKASILKTLPTDVEIGDTGRTVGQWMHEIEVETEGLGSDIRALNKGMTWHLQNLDAAGVELFVQIAEERGERAALEWADAYHGPAPAKSE